MYFPRVNISKQIGEYVNVPSLPARVKFEITEREERRRAEGRMEEALKFAVKARKELEAKEANRPLALVPGRDFEVFNIEKAWEAERKLWMEAFEEKLNNEAGEFEDYDPE